MASGGPAPRGDHTHCPCARPLPEGVRASEQRVSSWLLRSESGGDAGVDVVGRAPKDRPPGGAAAGAA